MSGLFNAGFVQGERSGFQPDKTGSIPVPRSVQERRQGAASRCQCEPGEFDSRLLLHDAQHRVLSSLQTSYGSDRHRCASPSPRHVPAGGTGPRTSKPGDEGSTPSRDTSGALRPLNSSCRVRLLVRSRASQARQAGSKPARGTNPCLHRRNRYCGYEPRKERSTHSGGARNKLPSLRDAAPRLRTGDTWLDSTRGRCGRVKWFHAGLISQKQQGSTPCARYADDSRRDARFISAAERGSIPLVSTAMERRPIGRTAVFEAAHPGSSPGAPTTSLSPPLRGFAHFKFHSGVVQWQDASF